MGIESFFTLQTGTNTSANADALKAVAPKQGALAGGLSSESFLEFIINRLNEANKQGTAVDAPASEDETALQSDNPLLDKDTKLDLAQILADNPEIAEEIEDFIAATGLPPEVALAQTLELNKQAFDDVLKPLTNGVITAEEIEKGSPRLLQALLSEFDAANEKQGELITSNLTPEQIAAIEKLELENTPEGKKAFLAELIQLVEPQTTASEAETLSDDPALQNLLAIFFPPQNIAKQNPANGNAQTDVIAARLNALNVGGDAALNLQSNNGSNAKGEPLFTIEEFEGSAEFTGKNGKAGKAADIGNFDTALKNVQNNTPAPANASNVLSAISNMFTGMGTAELGVPSEMTPEMLQQYGLNTASSGPATVGTMSAIITQAQSAAHAHPATHMVAATMQKAAGNGENKTLTLQLDPPELGRVKVKMDFGPDKTLKAVVSTDKPETFMMLQRDSANLERALQESGLDLGDGGLSFELAEHGFDFEQDNKRGGGHDAGGTGAGEIGEDDEEIIETRMNWRVDPESGHMRYNILA